MKVKHNLRVVKADIFDFQPDRYELRSGLRPDAPPCPYGHKFQWIGYDLQEQEYVRFTKSVFKRLVNQSDQSSVSENENLVSQSQKESDII